MESGRGVPVGVGVRVRVRVDVDDQVCVRDDEVVEETVDGWQAGWRQGADGWAHAQR